MVVVAASNAGGRNKTKHQKGANGGGSEYALPEKFAGMVAVSGCLYSPGSGSRSLAPFSVADAGLVSLYSVRLCLRHILH